MIEPFVLTLSLFTDEDGGRDVHFYMDGVKLESKY